MEAPYSFAFGCGVSGRNVCGCGMDRELESKSLDCQVFERRSGRFSVDRGGRGGLECGGLSVALLAAGRWACFGRTEYVQGCFCVEETYCRECWG
jgi:hypothetical protein